MDRIVHDHQRNAMDNLRSMGAAHSLRVGNDESLDGSEVAPRDTKSILPPLVSPSGEVAIALAEEHVSLFMAEENGMEGMWDWLSNDGSIASAQSFPSKEAAARDALEYLGILAHPAPSIPMHTPGPWTMELRPSTHPFQINGGFDLAHVCLEADAKLIVAAPELLEVLKACISKDGRYILDADVARARAIIAMAEGRSVDANSELDKILFEMEPD